MNLLRVHVLLAAFGLCHNLQAGSLDVTVKDGNGALVSDAVVYAKGRAVTSALAKNRMVIDQRDKQFIPYVTALQVGTSVLFPNNDNIRHHVYSLSPAKKFEQRVDLAARDAKELVFTLDLKPHFRAKRAPGLLTGGYR